MMKKAFSNQLADLQDFAVGDCLRNLRICCRNGTICASPIVLASISPWLKQVLLDTYVDAVVVIPDLKVNELSKFLDLLFKPIVDSLAIVTHWKSIANVLKTFGVPNIFAFDDVSDGDNLEWEERSQYLSDVDIASLSNEIIRDNFSDQHARLVCLVCYKIFSSEDHDAYKSHIKNHSRALLRKVKLRSKERGLLKIKATSKIQRVRTKLPCTTRARGQHTRVRETSTQRKDSKKHSCQICQKNFNNPERLDNHIANKICHDDSRRCLECNKLFADKTRLSIHMRLHANDKPFFCNICCKNFTQKRSLLEHQLIHREERTFHCEVCDKQFVQINHLKYHKASVHGLGGKHQCDRCKKVFAFPFQLKQHVSTHLS